MITEKNQDIAKSHNEASELFHVMQMSDSFFPTGLFATSNGIEKIFLDKKITTSTQLLDFIKTIIEQQIGPSDCVIVSNAHESAKKQNLNDIAELDRLCFAMKLIKETRDASVRSGNQLLKCVTEFVKDNKILDSYAKSLRDDRVTGIYPVSFAVCCSMLGISKQDTLSMFLYGFVVSSVGAALRLGIIDHYEGQRIIHQLKPLLKETSSEKLNSCVSEVWQFCPYSDISQMQHEKMDSKMFIT